MILAGQDVREIGTEDVAKLRTQFPVDEIALNWGPYIRLDDRFGPTPVTFFALAEHEYQARVYIEDMRGQQERMLGLLGAPNLPRLFFLERPRWLDIQPAPGYGSLVPVPENQLVYLHEGIWDLDRYDTDPTKVDFFLSLRGVQAGLRRTFRDRFGTMYFSGAFETPGPMGVWIERYLPSYIKKELEPNPWSRRWLLRFDAGIDVSPQMVRRSLQEIILTDRDNPQYVAAERLRGEGLWRTLHHHLGDDGWWRFVRTLLRQQHGAAIVLENVQEIAEETAGRPMDGFFDDWVRGSALPKYEITVAEAEIRQNPKSLLVSYHCRIHVRNLGTGAVDVPIFIKTELDELQRDIWIDSGGEADLELVLSSRPLFAAVDPLHWLLQETYREEGQRRGGHHELRFRIIEPSGAIFGGSDAA